MTLFPDHFITLTKESESRVEEEVEEESGGFEGEVEEEEEEERIAGIRVKLVS
jgi:hypothetical protein